MIDPILMSQLMGVRTLRQWMNLENTPSGQMIDGGGADTGGKNNFAHGTHVWTPGTPGTSGATLRFKPTRRQVGPWDNLYLYTTLDRTPFPGQYYSNDFTITYPTQDMIDAGTAIECELEKCESGLAYDMGLQYKPSRVDGPPAIRWFDESAQVWKSIASAPIPSPRPGIPIRIIGLFSMDRITKTTTHELMFVNGTAYPISTTHRARPKWAPQTNYFHAAVQIDSDGKGTPDGIDIRNWNVRAL